MCVERLNAAATALKVEAALAARIFSFTDALAKRKLASVIHQSLLKLESTSSRIYNQAYLDYWLHVTEGYVFLLAGRFNESRKAFKNALELSRTLSEPKTFPNYFRSRS